MKLTRRWLSLYLTILKSLRNLQNARNPVSIASTTLDCNFDELLDLIEKRLQAKKKQEAISTKLI